MSSMCKPMAAAASPNNQNASSTIAITKITTDQVHHLIAQLSSLAQQEARLAAVGDEPDSLGKNIRHSKHIPRHCSSRNHQPQIGIQGRESRCSGSKESPLSRSTMCHYRM
ncbi:hypothetical protein ACA910_004520 [Epithemia clementina (nom. ined.)]